MGYGKEVQDELREPARRLRAAIPAVYKSFATLHEAALTTGAVDAKTKELIALAISISKGCDGCIAAHARGAAFKGASPEEVAETIGVAILMTGGPGSVYGPRAYAAFQEFRDRRPAEPSAIEPAHTH